MPQPGQFNPAGEDAVIRRIQELERQVKELSAANPFKAMGIRPMPDGLIVDGYETVNGPLDVNGTMNVDGPQTVNGNSVFNGNMRIAGTLDLPAGIIGNDALSDPVIPVAYHADIQNISITSGQNVEKLHVDVAVPAGYTRALVNLTVTMNMLNNSGATDSAYLGANINGQSPGWSSNATAAVGAAVSLSNTVVALVTGLTGGTFPLTGRASSNTGTWTSAGTSSVMNLNATVQFLR